MSISNKKICEILLNLIREMQRYSSIYCVQQVDNTLEFTYLSVVDSIICKCKLGIHQLKFEIAMPEIERLIKTNELLLDIVRINDIRERLINNTEFPNTDLKVTDHSINLEYRLDKISRDIIQNRFYCLDKLLYICKRGNFNELNIVMKG